MPNNNEENKQNQSVFAEVEALIKLYKQTAEELDSKQYAIEKSKLKSNIPLAIIGLSLVAGTITAFIFPPASLGIIGIGMTVGLAGLFVGNNIGEYFHTKKFLKEDRKIGELSSKLKAIKNLLKEKNISIEKLGNKIIFKDEQNKDIDSVGRNKPKHLLRFNKALEFIKVFTTRFSQIATNKINTEGMNKTFVDITQEVKNEVQKEINKHKEDLNKQSEQMPKAGQVPSHKPNSEPKADQGKKDKKKKKKEIHIHVHINNNDSKSLDGTMNFSSRVESKKNQQYLSKKDEKKDDQKKSQIRKRSHSFTEFEASKKDERTNSKDI